MKEKQKDPRFNLLLIKNGYQLKKCKGMIFIQERFKQAVVLEILNYYNNHSEIQLKKISLPRISLNEIRAL